MQKITLTTPEERKKRRRCELACLLFLQKGNLVKKEGGESRLVEDARKINFSRQGRKEGLSFPSL